MQLFVNPGRSAKTPAWAPIENSWLVSGMQMSLRTPQMAFELDGRAWLVSAVATDLPSV